MATCSQAWHSSFKDADLSRITVSMDAVEPESFTRITRVRSGFNDDQIEAFGHFARNEGVILRFIEFMPLEEGRVWLPEIVARESDVLERLGKVAPLVTLPPNHPSETVRRYAFASWKGEIGIIAPVSRPFCGHCSRIRLTSDGRVRTCLFPRPNMTSPFFCTMEVHTMKWHGIFATPSVLRKHAIIFGSKVF